MNTDILRLTHLHSRSDVIIVFTPLPTQCLLLLFVADGRGGYDAMTLADSDLSIFDWFSIQKVKLCRAYNLKCDEARAKFNFIALKALMNFVSSSLKLN